MGTVLLLLLLLLLAPLGAGLLARLVAQVRSAPLAQGRRSGRELLITRVFDALSGPGRVGDALWRQGLVERIVADPRTPRTVLEACQLCRSADRVEVLLRRCGSPAEMVAVAQRISRATRQVIDYATSQGLAENLEEGQE
ncbi:MAG: hypothetical protein ACOVNL_02580 [Prochlorococcaceae cyanobacterium]|jgi:hypothetical protein